MVPLPSSELVQDPAHVEPGTSGPLPGGLASVFRFLLNDVPAWIQIGGLVVLGVALGVGVYLAVRKRSAIAAWFVGLPTVAIVALAVAVVAGAGGTAAAGYRIYDYTQHENAFCNSCHVMEDPFTRFQESAHAELACHDCHQQPLTASLRQVFLWVADRPEEVGPHAPVDNEVCTSCHVNGDPNQWPQIAASLGHRVHLESDDPELEDVMCVACHGVSVHTFVPVATTCGECHEEESEDFRLGDMRTDSELHCSACHDYLADEPATLEGLPEGLAVMPDRDTCLTCHRMQDVVVEEEFRDDPHRAVCGACHNPHTDEEPGRAADRCEDCHTEAEELTSFHRGRHEIAFPDCTRCHSAHTWQVDGMECENCHGPVPGASDTVSIGRQGAAPGGRTDGETDATSVQRAQVGGVVSSSGSPGGPSDPGIQRGDRPRPARASRPAAGRIGPVGAPAAGTDTLERRPFDHRDHREVSCVQCHRTGGDLHGEVMVRTPEDCGSCHHDADRGFECESCHADAPLPLDRSESLSFTVWEEARSRDLVFDHEPHGELACLDCHGRSPLMEMEAGCAECHAEHHADEAECTECHVAPPDSAHDLPSHTTCTGAGCHGSVEGTRPLMTRSVCLMCHEDQVDHQPGKDCKTCHMVPDRPGGDAT